MTYIFYTLSHPVSKSVFYVGVTRNDLVTRMRGHLTSKNTGNPQPVYRYMATEAEFGDPIIETIEVLELDSDEESRVVERYWIDQMRQWGFNLYNHLGNLSTGYSIPRKSFDRVDKVSIRMSKNVYDMAKAFCKERGFRFWQFVDNAIREMAELELSKIGKL